MSENPRELTEKIRASWTYTTDWNYSTTQRPAPAIIVIIGSAILFLAATITGVNSGTHELDAPYLVLLIVAILIPNLIALRHRRAGWLNQPTPGNGEYWSSQVANPVRLERRI